MNLTLRDLNNMKTHVIWTMLGPINNIRLIEKAQMLATSTIVPRTWRKSFLLYNVPSMKSTCNLYMYVHIHTSSQHTYMHTCVHATYTVLIPLQFESVWFRVQYNCLRVSLLKTTLL